MLWRLLLHRAMQLPLRRVVHMLGFAVFLCACIFWILGFVPWFDNAGYHKINWLFFYIGFCLMGCCPFYALMSRGGKAFSREIIEVADEETGDSTAPLQQHLLSA